jgi:hypothetical protein
MQLTNLVDVENVLGLGVEGVVVNILVVDTVLLTTGDTDLHLEPLLHGRSPLQVCLGGLDVVLDLLLGQIDHVAGEQGLVVLLEVGLVSVEHAVQPGQKLLGAVVGVQDDGDAVCGSDGTDVVSGGNSAGDGGLLVLVVDALTGEVGGTIPSQLVAHVVRVRGTCPPCDVCRMLRMCQWFENNGPAQATHMGDLASRAASRAGDG